MSLVIGLVVTGFLFLSTSYAGALETGRQAYKCMQGRVKSTYIVVDFSKSKNSRRFYLVDGPSGRVIKQLYVANGRGKGFSNRSGSRTSSIGVYITGNKYYGHTGLSLKLRGLDYGYNSNAYGRLIVLHGNYYVNEKTGAVGYSDGCFVLDKRYSSSIINSIGSNTMIVAYYPNQAWLNSSKYLNC